MNDINQTIGALISLYDNGRNPQELMQMAMQRNPNLNQMKTQLQNMANGRSPSEFIVQVARQNGVSEQNIQGLARILSAKK